MVRRSRFTEEQTIGILREQEAGTKVAKVCRTHGISETTFYAWKAKYGGLEVSEARQPQAINRRWSLGFTSVALSDGRRFRVLCVLDDFSRECLALVVYTSISGKRVARAVDQIIAWRDRPAMIVSDNRSELPSNAILRWAKERDAGDQEAAAARFAQLPQTGARCQKIPAEPSSLAP